MKHLGKCQDVLINPEVQPSVDYGAGAGDNTSENQPEIIENQLEEESVSEESPEESSELEPPITEEPVIGE